MVTRKISTKFTFFKRYVTITATKHFFTRKFVYIVKIRVHTVTVADNISNITSLIRLRFTQEADIFIGKITTITVMNVNK